MSTSNIRITIDQNAIRSNLQTIKNRIGPSVQMAVAVKANGYGLGIDAVVPIMDQYGIDAFYVANISEGIDVRSLTHKPIFVLGGFTSTDHLAVLRSYHLTPVVNTPPQIGMIKSHAPDLPWSLHIDTGMNRLGFSHDEYQALINDPASWRDLNIVQIMSHFACSDILGHPLNAQQGKQFDAALTSLHRAAGRKIPGSLANSSGIFRDISYHYQMVRPGMSVYGLNPTPETINPMQAVVKIEARVLQVRRVGKGQSVGYGATHTFDRDTTLVTIGGGYADGLIRALSSKGRAYFNDTPLHIVGRVSMDLISLAVPQDTTAPQLGDYVELVGPHQSADDIATYAGTIGYEILTQLSRRADRVIIPYTGAQPIAYSTSNVTGNRA